MKRNYLLEAAEVAQIVLVTEHCAFMMRLLEMRYNLTLRTNLNLSMTDDRKHNLHQLYQKSLDQEGMQGSYALNIIFHIAWIRTLEYFKEKELTSGSIS